MRADWQQIGFSPPCTSERLAHGGKGILSSGRSGLTEQFYSVAGDTRSIDPAAGNSGPGSIWRGNPGHEDSSRGEEDDEGPAERRAGSRGPRSAAGGQA
jgi:hypothetical protein